MCDLQVCCRQAHAAHHCRWAGMHLRPQGSSSSEASYSGRTGNSGLTDVWLQHAWKLPASPHLAVAAEGVLTPSAQNRHCIKQDCCRHCTIYFFCGQHGTASLPKIMH